MITADSVASSGCPSHPRRRASDTAPQPTLPQLGQVEITNELPDEIAWRVSQQIRRTQPPSGPEAKPATPAAAAPLPAVVAPERERMPRVIAIAIRVRAPLFRWRFWRRSRRRQSLFEHSDRRIQ